MTIAPQLTSLLGRPPIIALLAGALGLLAGPSPAASDPLILEAEIEPASMYVQAQARYTLRFYQAIDVRDLELHDPVLPLAELRRAGDDRIDEATRGGRRYRLTERRYVLSPFASGKLVLDGAHATGSVASSGGASPGAREPFRLDAPPLALEVRPIPPAAEDGPWLPARSVTLTESWAPQLQAARVGEPLYRIVRIEARGLDAAQLPTLELSGPGFQAYPETPRLENRLEDGFNIGIREQGFRIVPTLPGEVVVPALQMRWWDVMTDRMQIAELSETRIHVSLGAAGPAPAVPVPERAPPVETLPAPPLPARLSNKSDALIFVFALAGVAFLVGSCWLVFRAGQARRRSPLRALRHACRRNDAHAASEAILRWGAQRWPCDPPNSLGVLAGRLHDAQMRTAILELDRHRYGPPGAPWHPDALTAFSGEARPSPSRGTSDELPPLYSS